MERQPDEAARRAGMALLFATAEELTALIEAVQAKLDAIERSQQDWHKRRESVKRWGLFNSLRTELMEALWSLRQPANDES